MLGVRVAVLASGRGSNFEAIHRAVQKGELDATIVGLVSDQPSAPVVKKAQELGVPTFVVPVPKAQAGVSNVREKHEEELIRCLRPLSPHFLVMAGYMRIVTPRLIEEFRSERGYSRIVNIHPSFLPAFPGKDAYAQAFQSGARMTGVTVHLVDEQVDSGPICAQEKFSIADCKSVEEVEKRGIELEHRLYPETLRWVLKEEFKLDQKRSLCVRAN